LGFVLVCVVGIVAWFVGKGVGKEGRVVEVWDTSAQVVGWISAFLYREFLPLSHLRSRVGKLMRRVGRNECTVGSRLPQLALNRKTKCEGLSLLMFCFAVIGNVTFVAVRFSLFLPFPLPFPFLLRRLELTLFVFESVEYSFDFDVSSTFTRQRSVATRVRRYSLPRLCSFGTSEFFSIFISLEKRSLM